jgi:hypothetical protein
MTKSLVTVAAALLLMQARSADPQGYICYRASSRITIDGQLSDAAWRDAAWSQTFVDIEGDLKPKPTLQTRVKMLWDDTYFYVGAELVEPHVWATQTAHDSVIFHENDFELFVDPNGDNHEYYELEINALGTTWDLLLPRPYKDGGKPVNNWEMTGLKSAVHIDGTLNKGTDVDRMWSVELACPWSALGELARTTSPPKHGDQWRVNFSRVEWPLEFVNGAYRPIAGQHEHNWVWSPQHVVDMHRPEEWGYVQFSTKPAGADAFVADASLPARRWLQQVYYAQREFQKAHRRWATTLGELALSPPSTNDLSDVSLMVADSVYDASVTLKTRAESQRWHIRQDSLIWRD